MKVSLNWIKEFTSVDVSVAELVEKIGAQLGAVEEVVDLGQKYEGVVVAKVVKCSDHQGADKLKVCMIDDGGITPDVNRGENGLVQVVCGAPNVRENMLVAWLPPGSTVPSSFSHEPFVLEARELRGVISNGMLASPKELALGDSHEGLLEIDAECKPGDSFADVYKLNDTIIDIENKMFTHRPDCFGQLGVAREVAGVSGKAFKSPDWYTSDTSPRHPELVSGPDLKVSVNVEIPELCPRYMLVAVDNIVVAPSPVWLQSYLQRVGIRPINNIVDMTNYMMVLTGQPLHAFDFDKVAQGGSAQIVVRSPKKGEKMTLLYGKEIEPRADAILITANDKPVALGGVMGGNNSEIDAKTTRILIECANFDMYNIRRTSMEHGIFSEAVTRFNKGQSEWQCPPVLYKAAEMVQELCPEAKIASEVVDSHKPHRHNQAITVSALFVNERLGLELSGEDMKTLLENVEFTVSLEGDDLEVMAPFWRTDIEIAEDVVEEVGRLYGYDHLPLILPKRSITPAPKDQLLETKAKIRATLAKAGANEVLTYSFVHGNLIEKVGQKPEDAFQLSNALSPDLQYYRMSLVPSLLEKVHPNIKAGYDEFALFELGKVHDLEHEEDGLPAEFEFTSLVVAANDKLKKAGSAYYLARKYLTTLAGEGLDFKPIGKDMEKYAVVQPFNLNRAALVSLKNGGAFLGIIGEFKSSVTHNLKLPKFCAGFEVDTTELAKLSATNYEAIPRFPSVTQDITLKVKADLDYQELLSFVEPELTKLKPQNSQLSLTPLGIYQKEGDAAHKQVTFRLKIANHEKTMTDSEVNSLLDDVAKAAKTKFGAERI